MTQLNTLQEDNHCRQRGCILPEIPRPNATIVGGGFVVSCRGDRRSIETRNAMGERFTQILVVEMNVIIEYGVSIATAANIAGQRKIQCQAVTGMQVSR